MSKINYGNFSDTTYTKKVNFSKAVLWYKRQLSLRKEIIDQIKQRNIKEIIFIDELKKEKWIFDTSKVVSSMLLQRIGQEEQYYFPIDICKKENLNEKLDGI